MRRIRFSLMFILSFAPGFIKLLTYRHICHAQIGKNVRLKWGSLLDARHIKIGDNCTVGRFATICADNITLHRYVTIEDRVSICVFQFVAMSRSIVSHHAEIIGDVKDPQSVFQMGMHSWVFQYCYINATRAVTLGKNVGVGGRSFIFTHGYWLPEVDGYPVAYGSVKIGDDVWIPWDCFIMPGITIGNNVIIGARSLVTKSVADNALVAGSPARVIREKANKDVSLAEKIEWVKKELTEYYNASGKRLSICENDDRIFFKSNDRVDFAIHRSSIQENVLYNKRALNIVCFKCDRETLRKYMCFSMIDYETSSYEMISDIAKAWFVFSRRKGLRFYPIDEVELFVK